MHREQTTAIAAYLLIGTVCAIAGGWLAMRLGLSRLAWICAGAGLAITTAVFALFWRSILERCGYFGLDPERRQRYPVSRRAERWTRVAACGAIWLLFLAAGWTTGSHLGALACLLAMLAGLALSTGLAEAACIALTEARWRWRERDR